MTDTTRRFFRSVDPDAADVVIVDPDTGEEIQNVYEADIGSGSGGHLIQFVTDPNGHFEMMPFEATKSGGVHRKFKMTLDARDFNVLNKTTKEVVAVSRRVMASVVVESEPEVE